MFTPIILATWEAQVRVSKFEASLGQKKKKLSQKRRWHGNTHAYNPSLGNRVGDSKKF
jgi:hypothetical protein